MTKFPVDIPVTRVTRKIAAPASAIFEACTDPNLLVKWRVPDSMRAKIHRFDARPGGRFRMSLTYTDGDRTGGGKSTALSDIFEGRFAELVPDERVVELVEFEAGDIRFTGEMRVTTSLVSAEGGTEVTIACEDIPPGISLADNELGTRQSLEKLAALLEHVRAR